MTREALRDDKERMDEYAKQLANREPVKEWAVMYWLVVAVGHIIEWIVTR